MCSQPSATSSTSLAASMLSSLLGSDHTPLRTGTAALQQHQLLLEQLRQDPAVNGGASLLYGSDDAWHTAAKASNCVPASPPAERLHSMRYDFAVTGLNSADIVINPLLTGLDATGQARYRAMLDDVVAEAGTLPADHLNGSSGCGGGGSVCDHLPPTPARFSLATTGNDWMHTQSSSASPLKGATSNTPAANDCVRVPYHCQQLNHYPGQQQSWSSAAGGASPLGLLLGGDAGVTLGLDFSLHDDALPSGFEWQLGFEVASSFQTAGCEFDDLSDTRALDEFLSSVGAE